MKKITLLIIAGFLTLTLFSQSLSPEIIASAGDYFVGSDASLSWTIGEPIIETVSADGITLTQGFQQTYYTVLAIQDNDTDTYDVRIYPVPARDFINIEITSSVSPANLKLELFDVMGMRVYENFIESTIFHEKIQLSHYQTNMFFLKITNTTNQQVKTFKILKVRF
ncbi:MAG: T9SS type A sorting domain-containing protein [Bacteroidales bacterium]|nr:T9SS type A sorting domain-containing protein [Bacteroidales bacterium]